MNATEEYLTEAFKDQGLVTQELIDQTLEEVKNFEPAESSGDDGLDFMNLLLSKLELPTEEVVNFLGAEMNMDPIDLSMINPSAEILTLLSSEQARLYEAIPIDMDTFYVATFDNRADNVVPVLAPQFTEELKDKLRNESRLIYAETDPDISFSGSITEYRVSPRVVQEGEAANFSDLTIVAGTSKRFNNQNIACLRLNV